MSLKSFLSSLVPSFERTRIIEDIDSLATDNRDNLAPAYEQAAKLLTQARATLTQPPVSAAELEKTDRFRNLVRVPRGLPVPEEQARIEADIRNAIAARASEAGDSLQQAAERLATLGWREDNLTGARP